MKIFCVSFFSLILFKGIGAQGITISNEPVRVEYYRMPDQPLDASFTTYSAKLDIPYSELAGTSYTKSSLLDQYIRLDGYKEVPSHGDVEITANVGDFTIWSESRSSRRTKTKDKDGVERVKYTYYMEVRYSMPIGVEVYDKKGNSLLDRSVNSYGNTKTWTSPTYNNISDLESYWRVQRASRINQLQREEIESGMKKINDEINLNFGFRKMNETVKFEAVGKKKAAQYEAYQKNVEIIQNAFKQMSADQPLDNVRNAVKPALAFYAAEAAKCTSNSKDDVRLKHISVYNQALAYYWLEDFDQAEKLANELQKMNGKDKDAKRLLQDIDETRSSLSVAHRNSRHKVIIGKA